MVRGETAKNVMKPLIINEKTCAVPIGSGVVLGRAVIVSIILREKNNFWWAWDSIKECVCALAKLAVAIIWMVGAPFTIPVMVILDWKRIDHAAVNRFWNKWFTKKR